MEISLIGQLQQVRDIHFRNLNVGQPFFRLPYFFFEKLFLTSPYVHLMYVEEE